MLMTSWPYQKTCSKINEHLCMSFLKYILVDRVFGIWYLLACSFYKKPAQSDLTMTAVVRQFLISARDKLAAFRFFWYEANRKLLILFKCEYEKTTWLKCQSIAFSIAYLILFESQPLDRIADCS